jgi:ketosteroid isomerase-like protein
MNNTDIARRFIELVYGTDNKDEFLQVIDKDATFFCDAPLLKKVSTLETYFDTFIQLKNSLPDFKAEIRDVYGSNDRAFVSYHATCSFIGQEFLGVLPTEKSASFLSFWNLTIRDNKIVRVEKCWDQAHTFVELGIPLVDLEERLANLNTIRTFIEALSKSDKDTLTKHINPDITGLYMGRAPEHEGFYKGLEGVSKYFELTRDYHADKMFIDRMLYSTDAKTFAGYCTGERQKNRTKFEGTVFWDFDDQHRIKNIRSFIGYPTDKGSA